MSYYKLNNSTDNLTFEFWEVVAHQIFFFEKTLRCIVICHYRRLYCKDPRERYLPYGIYNIHKCKINNLERKIHNYLSINANIIHNITVHFPLEPMVVKNVWHYVNVTPFVFLITPLSFDDDTQGWEVNALMDQLLDNDAMYLK